MGLLETPSARMADDGQLSLTIGALRNTTRFALGFQLFPWLEGSFRYSSIDDFNGNAVDYDRSFGLKMRLFQETEYTPDVSFGIRDIIGTGIYGSEYFVATKRIWQFDVSAGLGWGRLAGDETFDNPFGLLFKSFDTRKFVGGSNSGGQVDLGEFFHGPDMGLFGGIVWRTPINNLDVIAEYGSDAYLRERADKVFSPRTPVNVGLAYRPLDNLTVTGGWLYGTSWGLVASLSMDPTKDNAPARLGPQPIAPQPRSDQDQQKAVHDYVNRQTTEDKIAAGGPFVGQGFKGPDAKVALVSQINNSSAEVRDAEVDGRTLVVDVRSQMTPADCKRYALLAAASSAPVESVAVVDLDRGKGVPVICPVPRAPSLPQTVYARLERMDAVESFADDSAPAGAPADAGAGSAPSLAPTPQQDAVDISAVESTLRTAAASQGLRVEGVRITAHEIVIYYSNTTYYHEADAIGRLARVLLAATPSNVEAMRMVAVVGGVPQQQIEVLRAPMERMFTQNADPVEIAQAITLRSPPMNTPVLDEGQSTTYPRLIWSLSPEFRQELFDPDEPLQVQVLVSGAATVEILPGLALTTDLEGNIYNDYNFARTSNSVLPHVRSDFAEYLQHGINGISTLYASYDTRLAPDVFFEAKAGYLEDMFAGGGIQALWRPEDTRWAVGIDAYEVQQRAYDRLFGFRNYRVLTGSVNVYYQSPWYGLNFAVHAGRYLARDYGATFEMTREFLTGVEIGAFATFTNVPFSKFGEGSFDKGLIIRVPIDWALPFNTQSSYDLDLRPLTRDGGQRLENDDSLYDTTRRTSYGEIYNHVEEIGYP
ncbi:MAG TPA: YjbH domain-containing protein [Rhizomicrobium sp.]|nr:YjbH domain-containing protein [Rhizomicrobium sp.]